MADHGSPRFPLSRRHFLAAATAAPAAQAGGLDPRGVAELARAWNADRDVIEQLSRRWQDLESALQRRTGSLDFTAAAAQGDAGAQEMIAIDRRLPGLFAADEAAAQRVCALPCRSLADALAKLQMGLRILGPHDGEEASRVLLSGGFADLVRLLGSRAAQ